jgi:aerobic carbon-monoxide dehydrogenase medium subunit
VTPFEMVEPGSVKEAIALIDPDDPDVRVIAGGTALMLLMKAGVFQPRRLVSMGKFSESLSGIAAAPSGELRIGAMTPLSAVEHSPQVLRHAPVIGRTMRRLSNVRVRNVATIGGALAHADPHMDLPPVLIALGASVSVVGTRGERTILVEDLLTGYYETALARNELIVDVRVPAQAAARAAYCKVTTGSADDWPALGVAVAIAVEDSTVKSARLVVSAATPKATRLVAAEEALVGFAADDAVLKAVADAAAGEVDILADVRGSASYKRELLRVYVARAIRAVMQANGAPR